MELKVVTVNPLDNVQHAYTLMQKYNIRHLLVTDAGKLLGVLSDRDLLKVGDIDDHGILHAPNELVDKIMTHNPITATKSTPISELCKLMADNHFDCVPIVDGEKVAGLVTSYDILRLVEKSAKSTNLADISFIFTMVS